MSKGKFLKIFSLTIIFSLLFSNVTFAMNPSVDPKIKEKIKNQIVADKELYKTIKEVEKYVIRLDDGTFEIKGKPNVSEIQLNNIKNQMSEVNKLIKEGYLTTDEKRIDTRCLDIAPVF